MKKEEVENYLHQKIEKGETVSPILPEGIKNYLIDIDGTICCLLYTSPSPRDYAASRMPSSA